jgi:sugar transferase (PEP-CTERM/EpsH1 system associated)
MRILFLTSRLPYPPYRGDRVRTYHFLRELGQEHEITLASFVQNEQERKHLAALAPFCRAIHVVPLTAAWSAMTAVGNVWRKRPLQALFYQSAAMQRLVDRLIAEEAFDVAYAHLFRMAPYLARQNSLYRIVDYTDLISHEVAASLPFRPPIWRAIYRIERPRIAAFEEEVAAWADEIWFINRRDLDLFSTRPHHAAVHAIPNVIGRAPLQERCQNDADDVLFVGNLDVYHNVDAVNYLVTEIMPLVWQALPHVNLNVVGAGSTEGLRALSTDPRVHIIGFMPDLEEAYAANAVFTAPLRFAAGTQNKVIEAMAAGLPVVLTEAVFAGLDAGSRDVALVAEDAQGLAGHIVRLIQDRGLRVELGAGGQAFVREHFSQTAVLDHMRDLARHLHA